MKLKKMKYIVLGSLVFLSGVAIGIIWPASIIVSLPLIAGGGVLTVAAIVRWWRLRLDDYEYDSI